MKGTTAEDAKTAAAAALPTVRLRRATTQLKQQQMQFQAIPSAAALRLQLIQHLLGQHAPAPAAVAVRSQQQLILSPAASMTAAAAAAARSQQQGLQQMVLSPAASMTAAAPAAAAPARRATPEPTAEPEPLPEPKLVLTAFLPQPEPQPPQQPAAAQLHGPDTEPLPVEHELVLQAFLQPKPQPLVPTRPLLLTEQEQQQQQQPLPASQSLGSQQLRLWCVTKERAAAAELAPVDSMPSRRTGDMRSSTREVSALGASGFRGVTLHKRTTKWEAHLWVGGNRSSRQIFLGGFDTDCEAAMAYDLTAIRFFGGRQAVTNFGLATYLPELAALDAEQLNVAAGTAVADGLQMPASLLTGPEVVAWRGVLRGKTGSARKPTGQDHGSYSQGGCLPRASDTQAAGHSSWDGTASPTPTPSVSWDSGASQPGPQRRGRKRPRLVSSRLREVFDAGDSSTLVLQLLPDDLLACLHACQPPAELQPLPQWGGRRRRSKRAYWPAGCSAHLVSSLAGQNGQAALRAAGLTEQYRQRLLQSAPRAGAAGQHGPAGEDSEAALDAAMQPLQAAAALPAAVAALKLRQQQLKLLQERREYQQRHGQQSESEGESEGADDMDTEPPLLAAAAIAATATAGVERLAAAAALAAEASEDEQWEERDEAQQQPGGAAVFQAMDSVLQEVSVHNYGLGAYLTELLVDWPEAKRVGTAAAAAAASVAASGLTGSSMRLESLAECALVLAFGQRGQATASGGGGSAERTVSAEQQQLAQQRILALHQLVTRCLQQQEAAEQSLLDMRGIVGNLLAPQLGQNGLADPESSLQQLQQLHKQHAASLGNMLRSLRQLQAGLKAAVASLQDELRVAGQVLGQGVRQAVEVLVAQCWKDWQAAWDHVVQSMKLLGLNPPRS